MESLFGKTVVPERSPPHPPRIPTGTKLENIFGKKPRKKSEPAVRVVSFWILGGCGGEPVWPLTLKFSNNFDFPLQLGCRCRITYYRTELGAGGWTSGRACRVGSDMVDFRVLEPGSEPRNASRKNEKRWRFFFCKFSTILQFFFHKMLKNS